MAVPDYYFFGGINSGNPFQQTTNTLPFADASIAAKVAAIKRLNSRFAISNKSWHAFDSIATDSGIDEFGYGPSGHANADVRKYSKTAQHWDPSGGSGGTISNIKLGSTALDSIYIGSTAVSKVYVGSTQVWGAASAGGYDTQTIFFEGYQVTVTTTSGAYVIDGWDKNGPISNVSNKNIAMSAGSIIKFNLDATGHPFWIKTVQGNGTGNSYQNTDYISNNNGKVSGYTVFSPPSTGTWYYNCEYHTAMTGTIVVS